MIDSIFLVRGVPYTVTIYATTHGHSIRDVNGMCHVLVDMML